MSMIGQSILLNYMTVTAADGFSKRAGVWQCNPTRHRGACRNPGKLLMMRKSSGESWVWLPACLFHRRLFLENLQNRADIRAKKLLEIIRRIGGQEGAVGFQPAPLGSGTS